MEQNTGTHFENIFASKSSLKPSLSIKRVGAPNFLVFLMVPPPLTLTCWQYLEQLSLKSAAASSPFSFSFGQIKFPHKEGLLAFILTRDMKKTIIGFQNCFSFSPYQPLYNILSVRHLENIYSSQGSFCENINKGITQLI